MDPHTGSLLPHPHVLLSGLPFFPVYLPPFTRMPEPALGHIVFQCESSLPDHTCKTLTNQTYEVGCTLGMGTRFA